MAVLLSPIGGVAAQFFDNSGNVLTGGKIYTYAAGTTTNQATYTSATGVTFHTNPIILDASGRVPSGEIWLTDNVSYKFVLTDSNDVLIGTYDNIVGINSNFVNYTIQEEIQTATAGQTVFTLATASYTPGTNTLSVFVDGVNQYDGSSYAYVETDSNTVTFTAGLHVGALVKFTTAVTLSAGVTDASLVTYDPPFTGSVLTTVELKLAQTVSVKDFGAVGDGTTDDTAAIQSAITAVAVTGGTVWFPAGTYKCTSTINMAKFVNLKGDGIRATTLQWNTTGDGIKMTSPINTSTPVNTGVYDINLYNTNASNTGGGYVDVCGTYVYLERVRIVGFKYGIIFDQTELGDIYLCEIQQQITAGFWLVNGSDHTVGANTLFTNRISAKSCQFNQSATAYCIIDDGGYSHTFDANNFNGGLTHIRNAGQIAVNISNSEFESAASTSLVWTNTTFNSAAAVGQSVNINLQNNLIVPTAGQYCVNMSNGTPLVALNNYFGNSSVAKINGLTNVNQFVDIANISGGGTYSSGTPTINFALSSGTFTPAISFAVAGDLAVTYSTQIGQYQKFGNAVTFSIVLTTSAFTWTTASGNLKITGLPFAANSTSNFNQAMNFRFQGITKAGYSQFTPVTDYGQTFLLVGASGSGAGAAGVVAADVPSGGTVYLVISGTYLI